MARLGRAFLPHNQGLGQKAALLEVPHKCRQGAVGARHQVALEEREMVAVGVPGIVGRLRWGKNHRLSRAEGKGARTGRGPGRGGGAAADSVENARRLGGANPAWNDSRELSDSRRGGPQRAAFGHDVVRRRRGRVEPGEHCARKRRSAAGQRRRTGEAGRNRKCRPRGRQIG